MRARAPYLTSAVSRRRPAAPSPTVARAAAVHSRIVLEDGRFYLEDAGSAFGTYAGLNKGAYFEINGGDELMLAGARCKVMSWPFTFRPIDGILSKILGEGATKYDHQVQILGTTSVVDRLAIQKPPAIK